MVRSVLSPYRDSHALLWLFLMVRPNPAINASRQRRQLAAFIDARIVHLSSIVDVQTLEHIGAGDGPGHPEDAVRRLRAKCEASIERGEQRRNELTLKALRQYVDGPDEPSRFAQCTFGDVVMAPTELIERTIDKLLRSDAAHAVVDIDADVPKTFEQFIDALLPTQVGAAFERLKRQQPSLPRTLGLMRLADHTTRVRPERGPYRPTLPVHPRFRSPKLAPLFHGRHEPAA